MFNLVLLAANYIKLLEAQAACDSGLIKNRSTNDGMSCPSTRDGSFTLQPTPHVVDILVSSKGLHLDPAVDGIFIDPPANKA